MYRSLVIVTVGWLVVANVCAARGQCELSESRKIVGSTTGPGDHFGNAVAMTGNTVIVGSFRDNSAYAFVRDGVMWMEQAKLTASDGDPQDEFGISVAISADTAVVGAHYDDVVGEVSGSAYVFVRDGSTWSQQAKLTPSDGAAGDKFGYAVAVSGDTIVVGAYGDDDAGSDAGSAYVFTRTGSSWTEQSKLTASDATEWDTFGYAVAIADGTLVVGAHGEPVHEPTNSGAAYVFTWNGPMWAEQQKLGAAEPSQGEQFGCSVSISEDTIVIGARGNYAAGGHFYGSAAYVFDRNGSTWLQEAKLTPSDPSEWDAFGLSVSIYLDTVVVGALQSDQAGVDSGAAYVFNRPASGWVDMTETGKLSPSDAAGADEFGCAVALDGSTAVVGAWGHDDDSGSAYLFDGVSNPCGAIPVLSEWGLIVMTLLALPVGTIMFRWHRPAAA